MIKRQELEHAIETYENSPNLNIDTCVKLAALYTIYNELFIYAEPKPKIETIQTVETDESTEFLQVINGKHFDDVMGVMSELMETLSVINRNGYDGVIRKLQNLEAV